MWPQLRAADVANTGAGRRHGAARVFVVDMESGRVALARKGGPDTLESSGTIRPR